MLKLSRFLFVFILLTGCAATVESRLDSVRMGYMTAPVEKNIDSEKNLDLLINADALFHSGDYAQSDALYEKFNRKNSDITSGDIVRELSGVAFGANANDYRPYMMDSLFVSYYQLWMAIADGRWNDARVIINQSYSRQQDMSREYEKLIESNKAALDKHSEIADKIQNVNWTAYRNIMNPALMYLSGIYFLNMGEFDDATTYLRRANGMMPENNFIARDLKNAESRIRPQNTTWVFLEDGFAPKLTEERITFPIATQGGFTTLTVAMSEPVFSNNFTNIDGAKKLADVDAMFMTEYGEYRINDGLRAFASAASRMALQSAAYNSHSDSAPIMGLLSTIYSEFTNSADVRTWATLPKTISVMRIDKNKSGLIEIKSRGNVMETIPVPTSGNHLVYVRIGPKTNDIKVLKLK